MNKSSMKKKFMYSHINSVSPYLKKYCTKRLRGVSQLWVYSALALFSNGAHTAEAISPISTPVPSTIETITVSGTKTSRQINEIASSVTRIQAEQIDAIAANDIRDLLRYEPGIAVEGNGRFGLAGFNIRGVNGDRVLILLDRVPIADEFSFGPALSSRRDFVDIDLIASVDIVRGPASTLYGSDAIGGVVAFTSKDPIDLLEDGDRFASRVKAGFASQANDYLGNVMLAGVLDEDEKWQWLFNTSIRRSDEVESFFSDELTGSDRKSTDPQSIDGQTLLTKLIYQPNLHHRLELTLDALEQDADTSILSEVGNVVRGTAILESVGMDQQKRQRLSAEYTFTNDADSHFKRLSLLAFYQQSETDQISLTQRQNLASEPNTGLVNRSRDSHFEQQIAGLQLQMDHQFSTALLEHYLIYGLSLEQTDSEALREGQSIDALSNQNIPEFTIFPARDFPPSQLNEYSLFIQDEITLFNGALTLSPGIRYDKFELTPEQDALFETSNPGVEIAPFDDSEFSVKLGAIYRFNEDLSLWYQFAEGFRIPPMDDVNVGFTNFAGGYTSLANPDLLPEIVVSNELGLRVSTDAFDFSISAYINDYDNFIESLALNGFNPATGLLEFQARNIDEVEIRGVDASATWFVGESFESMANWMFRVSYSKQKSEDKATGAELDSILPAQSVLGISYGALDAPWRIELAATHSEEANIVENTADAPAFFVAPSYTLFDLLGHYELSPNIRINGGIFNLFDKEYYLASEVRGRTESENLGRFSSPGRNASVNIVVNF
ncbi:TonB-dependent hemoglobin/transferrin/lactoferrin family receptor [Ningiella sp. W23]|uniref:TonB-dependent hemoglobin/transferrin/lactoferrin family receptor n=1 Tax=Ningiella sp. W23 TaxID=3023715 RepID=UPI003757F243